MKLNKSAVSFCVFEQLEGYANGGISLQTALCALQKAYGPRIVVHGMHCLTRL